MLDCFALKAGLLETKLNSVSYQSHEYLRISLFHPLRDMSYLIFYCLVTLVCFAASQDTII